MHTSNRAHKSHIMCFASWLWADSTDRCQMLCGDFWCSWLRSEWLHSETNLWGCETQLSLCLHAQKHTPLGPLLIWGISPLILTQVSCTSHLRLNLCPGFCRYLFVTLWLRLNIDRRPIWGHRSHQSPLAYYFAVQRHLWAMRVRNLILLSLF